MIPAVDLAAVPWADIVCAVVLLGYAVGGWRSGLLASGFALAGFVAGGILAFVVLPQVRDILPEDAARPWVRPALVIALAVLMAVFGQLLGGIIGVRLKRGLEHPLIRFVDAVGGLVLALVTTALALWLVGGAARSMSAGRVSAAVGKSVVLHEIDRHVPPPVVDAAARLRRALVEQGLPQVFSGIGREPIPPAAAPEASGLPRAHAAVVAASVVRVDGSAPQCQRSSEGSGWVFAQGRVVTNAHVVAGSRSVSVTSNGQQLEATVVRFDPGKDVAILDVPGLVAPVLAQGGMPAPGVPGAIAGYPLGGNLRIAPVRVRDTLRAQGWDIYGRVQVTRMVISLRGTVLPGNSGGPVVDDQGRAMGLVFARSLDDPDTGYALTMEEIRSDLDAARGASTPVSTQACARL